MKSTNYYSCFNSYFCCYHYLYDYYFLYIVLIRQDLQGKLEVAEKLVLQYDSSSAKLVDTTNRLEAANAKFKEEDEKKVEVFMKCTDRFEKYRALCHSLLRFNALNQTKFKKYRYFNALRHYSLSRSNSSSSGISFFALLNIDCVVC